MWLFCIHVSCLKSLDSKITKNIRNSCGGAWNSERRIAQYYCKLTTLFFGSPILEKLACKPCLGTCSWQPCLGTCSHAWELGALFLEPLLVNLFLRTLPGNLVLRTLLGNLFPGPLLGNLGTWLGNFPGNLACKPVPGKFDWKSCSWGGCRPQAYVRLRKNVPKQVSKKRLPSRYPGRGSQARLNS